MSLFVCRYLFAELKYYKQKFRKIVCHFIIEVSFYKALNIYRSGK